MKSKVILTLDHTCDEYENRHAELGAKVTADRAGLEALEDQITDALKAMRRRDWSKDKAAAKIVPGEQETVVRMRIYEEGRLFCWADLGWPTVSGKPDTFAAQVKALNEFLGSLKFSAD